MYQVKTPKCIMILKYQRCKCRRKPENKLLTGQSMNIIEVAMLMTAHILLYSKTKRRKLTFSIQRVTFNVLTSVANSPQAISI